MRLFSLQRRLPTIVMTRQANCIRAEAGQLPRKAFDLGNTTFVVALDGG
jgi:hypothetical protein